MSNAYFFDGLRSPFGRFAGSLSRLRPDDLAGQVISALVAQSNIDINTIEDVILGNTNQAGEDSRNLARHAALLSGLPVEVPGITVNRLCGSGMAAVLDAARCVSAHQGAVFIAGGSEVMSRAPWVMAKAQTAFDRAQKVEDSMIGARFPNPKITELYGNPTMPQTAENIASDFGIDRESCDRFAEQSQRRYQTALKQGFFENEITPIRVPGPTTKHPVETHCLDEHPRPETDLASLNRLASLHSGGVVTAGNASGINDGAAAIIVASLEAGTRQSLVPRARLIAAAVAGIAPRIMGLGPVPACKKALERAGLTIQQMDLIEINEAFASQVLGCALEMGISPCEERLNPNGGAIAIGHPLGASGTRLVITAINQLQVTGGRYALLSMCIGVGQGIAMVIERV